MDPALLTDPSFWSNPEPTTADGTAMDFGVFPKLAGHVLFQTSGSSGAPKWVAISKQALLISAAAVNRHLQVTSDSVWGLALPVHHVGGFGVVARAFEAGCQLEVFRQRWDSEKFREWVGRKGVTHTSLVPTQVHDLVQARLTAPARLAAIVVGGGRLDQSTGQVARDLGWPVLASFGMTEASSQIATQGLDLLQAPYQAAPIPLLPIWKSRSSENGLLEISGPALFTGYFADGKFSPRDSEWHRTSDRVALDADQLSPLGRNDFWVKVLGELVNPEEIERELIELSCNTLRAGDFAVIAIPDERAGHLLVPVFQSDFDRDTIGSSLAAYHRKAPGFRRLQPATVVETLPRSVLGKLQRARLAELYQQSRTS